ncbi:MAG: adenosylhomocysteinase [Nitrososphaerota archaeon]|nr:adenosylhomocysteinase [Candidatus Geocrenenecus dongiae]
MKDYLIKDISLSSIGKKKIEWAEAQMPVLLMIRERFSKEKPFKNLRISLCLHVTKETAVLARTLREGGATVYMCAANPLSTQDDVAAALVEDGVHVYAWRGMDLRSYYQAIGYVISFLPNITIDDGADVISTIHKFYYKIDSEDTRIIREAVKEISIEDLLKNILGGCEETTTGVIRIKSLEKEGKLLYPIIAVNEALSKSLFDNPVGTGQSTLDGIMRATNILLAGRDVVVVGFGRVGSGIAYRARGMGARVTIVEVDPIKALRAAMDGFNVESMKKAAGHGEVFITATGNINVIRREHFELMRDGVILANAGHFDVEISKKDLEELSIRREKTSEHITTYILKDGRRLHLLADGRVVNLACGEGHPSAVMDLSFSLQALSAEYIVKNYDKMTKTVIPVPEELDKIVAIMKLRSMGLEIEEMTEEQKRYSESWLMGT